MLVNNRTLMGRIAAYAERSKDPDWSNVDLSLSVRVVRGLAYLVEVYREELSTVDIATLRMAGSSTCILGQLWGSYGESPEYNIHSADWLYAHGFVPGDHMGGSYPVDGGELTRTWRRVLRAFRTVQ